MLFIDPEHQVYFDENGYIVVDLLDSMQVEALLGLYGDTVADVPQEDLFESSRHSSLEMNFRVMEGIRKIIEAPASRFFGGGTLYGGTYMVKVPETSKMLPLHQDWNVVEEDRFQSAFIWCALVDIPAERGGFFVLPGSHHYFHNIRSGNMPSLRIDPEGPLADLIVEVPVRAGQAIVWLDRVFHGTWANQTPGPRIVCTARVNEEGSHLVYYHQADDDYASVIAASPEFYLKEIGKLACGEMVENLDIMKTIPNRYVGITEERLLTRLTELGKLPQASGQPETVGN